MYSDMGRWGNNFFEVIGEGFIEVELVVVIDWEVGMV